MTRSLVVLAGVTLLFAASAAAQTPPPVTAAPSTRVLTADGSVLHGAITGGTLAVKTSFGEVRVEARRVQTVRGTTVALDDGSVLHGTLGAGQVQLTSAFGTLTIPVDRVTEIQDLRKAAGPASPTAAAPPAPAARPTPPKAVAAKPTTAAVQLLNETRRNLNVCLNEEPCLQLGPSASTTRTLPVGTLRMRVEATTTLGFVVLATGSFERSMPLEGDQVVRIAENDFR